MSDKYPPNDQDTYDVLTPTGRRPQPPEPQRVIGIIGHHRSATLAAIVACDFSEIESRVMAQMKGDEDADD